MILNKKAQAAITDALFFLTIIIALSVLMFKYSSTYGDQVYNSTQDLYFKEYTNSALKSIFFTQIPLSFDKNIDQVKEVDYLMTAIKSDFYSDGQIGASKDINTFVDDSSSLKNDDIAKYQLFSSIKSLMYPLPSYDYLFYLLNNNNNKFEFFLIKINEYEIKEQNNSFRTDVSFDSKDNIYYLCEPSSYSVLRDKMSNTNYIFSSSMPLQFTKKINTGISEIKISSTFALWPSSASIDKKLLEDELMKCKEIKID